MTIIEAAVLGVVQGITEFLPVSSSGHLIAFPAIFGFEQQGMDFDVMIHVATLLAIIWVLRKDIGDIIKGVITGKGKQRSLGWKIVVATIPAVMVGLLISSTYLESIRSVRIVAINLMLFGAILWAADWYAAKTNHKVKKSEDTSWGRAIVIGLSQALALIPGTSRSGVTMSAGLFVGLDRKTAAKFSFLLAIPVIAGAGFLTGLDAVRNGFETAALPMIVGFITAFLSGIVAIKFLLKFLEKADYKWFAAYRIILGILLLMFIA